MIDLIRRTIEAFCLDFIDNPYKCYTEHGQHALFYTMLFNALPEEDRYVCWEGKKICRIQKEYPTAGKLSKGQRSHWDISILKSPVESLRPEPGSYDFLKLYAAIEFGMNESKEHLKDDIDRLCDEDSNVEHRFIVHLYRLSKSGARFSNRDWSSKSPRILRVDQVQDISDGRPVEVYYALTGKTGERSIFWRSTDQQ